MSSPNKDFIHEALGDEDKVLIPTPSIARTRLPKLKSFSASRNARARTARTTTYRSTTSSATTTARPRNRSILSRPPHGKANRCRRADGWYRVAFRWRK